MSGKEHGAVCSANASGHECSRAVPSAATPDDPRAKEQQEGAVDAKGKVVPPLVIIFLKAPRPGLVKTRLGRAIGFKEAAVVYRRLAEQQLDRIPADFSTEIRYAPRGAAEEMRAWLGRNRSFRPQGGGDLGARMSDAFLSAFRRGHSRILAIGADCPDLDGACLRRSCELLDSNDVVIGPANDGGYYLIGLRNPEPRLFESIAWSTSSVFASTLARIRERGLSHALLDEKEDIDDRAGLERFVAKAPGVPCLPPSRRRDG